MIDIKREVEEELDYQMKLFEKLGKEIAILPAGSLCTKLINGREYVYLQERTLDKNGTSKILQHYVSQKDTQLAENVLRRRFAEKSMMKLKKSIWQLESFLKKYEPYSATDVYESLPKAYVKFDICGYLSKSEREIIAWNEQFKGDLEKNSKENTSIYPEYLKHVTSKGLKVRSKSEAIICELMDYHNIQFRYEKMLFVSENKVYPDFTIMRKFDRKIIYWEHFGMLNDVDYSQNMVKKLRAYEDVGIIPWDNLIVTTDSIDGRINIKHIKTIIINMLMTSE